MESMSQPATETWTLTVVPLPDAVPSEVRIRRFLKAALRTWRLRVTAIRETEAARGRPPSRTTSPALTSGASIAAVETRDKR